MANALSVRTDLTRFKTLGKSKISIFIGHSDGENSEKSKSNYFGEATGPYEGSFNHQLVRVYTIAERPYLTDFIKENYSEVVNKFKYLSKFMIYKSMARNVARQLGKELVNELKQWVWMGPYTESMPNPDVVKQAKGNDILYKPELIDSGDMINSLESVVRIE